MPTQSFQTTRNNPEQSTQLKRTLSRKGYSATNPAGYEVNRSYGQRFPKESQP